MRRFFFLLFLLFAAALTSWSWFNRLRPSPTLEFGRDTTFIDGPLTDEGWPDYREAIELRMRKGITPQTNGAVPFWQAIGPNEEVINNDEYVLICRDIGGEPGDGPFLVDPDGKQSLEKLNDLLQGRFGDFVSFGGIDFETEEAAASMLQAARRYAWKEQDLPHLAQQIKDNRSAMNLLEMAAKRPHFYSPSPGRLNGEDEMVIEIKLSHTQMLRAAARAFGTRSMNHLGQGDVNEAIRDAETTLRLAEHCSGFCMIEELMRIATRRMAYDCFASIISHDETTPQHAERILNILDGIVEIDVTTVIDNGERMAFLDAMLRTTTGRSEDTAELRKQFLRNCDSNIPLRMGNQFFDQLVAMGDAKDWQERTKLDEALIDDIHSLNANTLGRATAFFSRSVRSRQIGTIIVALMLPAARRAYETAELDTARRSVLMVACAARLHQMQRDNLPKQVDDLLKSRPKLQTACQKHRIHWAVLDGGFIVFADGNNQMNDGGDDEFELVNRDSPYVVRNQKWSLVGDATDAEPGGDDITFLYPMPTLTWGAKPAKEPSSSNDN